MVGAYYHDRFLGGDRMHKTTLLLPWMAAGLLLS